MYYTQWILKQLCRLALCFWSGTPIIYTYSFEFDIILTQHAFHQPQYQPSQLTPPCLLNGQAGAHWVGSGGISDVIGKQRSCWGQVELRGKSQICGVC